MEKTYKLTQEEIMEAAPLAASRQVSVYNNRIVDLI